MTVCLLGGLCWERARMVLLGPGVRLPKMEASWACHLLFPTRQQPPSAVGARPRRASTALEVAYLSHTRRRKSLTRLSWRLQMLLCRALLSQSSTLHTCTRLEYQQMERLLRAGLSRKLSFLSSRRDRKCSRGQSAGSSNTSWSWGQVLARFFQSGLAESSRPLEEMGHHQAAGNGAGHGLA